MTKRIFHPMQAKDSTIVVDGKVTSTKFKEGQLWLCERKYDGARYILQWDENGTVYFTSRHVSVKDNLPSDKTENLKGYLFDDAPELAGITLDGEILVQYKDDKGQWQFYRGNGSGEVNRIMLAGPDKARERLKDPSIRVVYVVFDILTHQVSDGTQRVVQDITDKPVEVRKNYVEDALVLLDNFYKSKYGDWETAKVERCDKYILSMPLPPTDAGLQQSLDEGFEGVMLKQKGSPYCQGEHSKFWQKVKKLVTEDGVLIGVQKGTGEHAKMAGALIIGQFFKLQSGGEKWKTLNELCDQGVIGDREMFVQNGACYHWRWEKTPSSGNDVREIYELNEVCTISGMTVDDRKAYWSAFQLDEKSNNAYYDPEDDTRILFYPDKLDMFSQVVEFMAQEKTSKRYRHPRFVQYRGDKNMVDCIFYPTE